MREKKYDIEKRLIDFAVDIIFLLKVLKQHQNQNTLLNSLFKCSNVRYSILHESEQ
jgi:hypothetical protein